MLRGIIRALALSAVEWRGMGEHSSAHVLEGPEVPRGTTLEGSGEKYFFLDY